MSITKVQKKFSHEYQIHLHAMIKHSKINSLSMSYSEGIQNVRKVIPPCIIKEGYYKTITLYIRVAHKTLFSLFVEQFAFIYFSLF